jgi:adenylate cyclase
MDNAQDIERRLAAILSADVAGYSRMMAADEVATVLAVKQCREIIDTHVREHHGRVVDSPGDNVLAEFPSAVEAVRCAVEVQRELTDNNRALEASRRMEFRIGIHVGDVIHDGGKIYGDGVNIAARLEALATSGGICISREVHDQIRGKLDIDCEDIGEQQVKNIPRPVRVLRVRMGPAPIASATRPPSRRRVIVGSIATLGVLAASAALYFVIGRNSHPSSLTVPAAEPSKATVAVLPFANLSANQNDEYFTDGMTDEITGQLSKIAGLQVAARTSSFAFKNKNEDASRIASLLHVRNLLEGSVQRSTDKLRIEVQLIDATNGFTLWSERYDEKMADVFAIQSRVAEGVADKLRIKLLPQLKGRIDQRPTQNLAAYDLYLQGQYYASQFSEDGFVKANGAFRSAISMDPQFAKAYVGLADALANDLTLSPRQAIPQVRAAIEPALAIDDSLGEAHGVLAYGVLYSYDWNWPAAEREFLRALELDPGNALIHGEYGEFLEHMGRFDEALHEVLQAYELNPLGARTVVQVGLVYRDLGDHKRALEYLNRALDMAPDSPFIGVSVGVVNVLDANYGGALPFFEKAARSQAPIAEGWLGLTYARLGRKEETLKLLSQLKEQSTYRYVDATSFDLIYFGLGDMDKAFQALEQAYRDRSYFLTTMKLPMWGLDPTIRSDPRFKALYKKVGLPE